MMERRTPNENGFLENNLPENIPFNAEDSIFSSNLFLDGDGEVILTQTSDRLYWKSVESVLNVSFLMFVFVSQIPIILIVSLLSLMVFYPFPHILCVLALYSNVCFSMISFILNNLLGLLVTMHF